MKPNPPPTPESPRPPTDHAMRDRALDEHHSFIVQAPAGSGKTELLVRRYLTLLAKVEKPEQILAITFTNKATAEMRARILQALQPEADAESEAESTASPELRTLATAARANDAKHNWRITRNTRRLRIQTIDAFCNELVGRMPWSARFGAPPRIVEGDAARALYHLAAANALAHLEYRNQWSDDCAALLQLVDADWRRAQTLLADMLEKRDKWMTILGENPRDDRSHFEKMWQQHVDTVLQESHQAIPPETQAELLALIKSTKSAQAEEEDDPTSPLAALRDLKKFPPGEHPARTHWRALADLLLTQKNEPRKSITKRQGFPAPSTAPNPAAKAILQANKERMQAFLSHLADHPPIVAALADARALPPAKFTDPQWQSLSALMRLLRLVSGELHALFQEHNQADYIQLTQGATRALGDSDGPSDLALRLDYRLTHLLVDEFQDTSSAHMELLEHLTAGWQPDDGHTLFFVGDPMQSIYRFREAEVGNFLHVWETKRFGGMPVQPIPLQSNFRSTPDLVDWFNRVFSQVMPASNNETTGAVRYAPAEAYQSAPPPAHAPTAVHTQFATARTPEEEAEHIATLVEEILQQNPPNQTSPPHEDTIAILGRARAHLNQIATALRRRQIPFQAIELEKLNHRLPIRDLTSLTRALLQPADRIAWLSLLRAPWCGLSLADLADLTALTQNEPDHRTPLFDLCTDLCAARNTAPPQTLSPEGQTRLRRFLAAITPAMTRRGRIPLRQNVEAAWLALGGPATIEKTDLSDCRLFLDLLSRLENEQREITAALLTEACESLWAQSGAYARVQLLTIHKAKGLEFAHVILPRLGDSTPGDKADLLRWRKLPDKLLIAPLPPTAPDEETPEAQDAFYTYLKGVEKTHHHNETARLLYVACTRARRSLHLFGSARPRKADTDTPSEVPPRAGSLLSFLSFLWEHTQPESPPPPETATPDPDTPTPPLQRLPLNWTPPPLPPTIAFAPPTPPTAPEEQIEFSWAGESARIIGVVIHRILQEIGQPNSNSDSNWENWQRAGITATQKRAWRNQLAQHGIPETELANALARVTDAIKKTQADPRAAWIFSPTHRNIRTEWSLAGWVAAPKNPDESTKSNPSRIAHITIDRSFTDQENTCWIIDFKSSRHEGTDLDAFLREQQKRYHDQMTRYATLVRQFLTPNVTDKPTPIRLGLYFPALQGWREWSAEE